MRYLMIENNGVCPIQGIDLLGASTARGTDKIGQFGTGLKHGFTLLLREGVKAFAFLGTKKVEFYSKSEHVGDREFKRVYFSVDDVEHKTSWCEDFGAIDWKEPEMALREFISNAIDQNDGEACDINIVSEAEGREDTTRIFVEYKSFVRKYYSELEDKFLHFRDGHELGKKVFPNSDNSGPTIYRKGVFVRKETIEKNEAPALYNYDFADINIDECRNLSNSSMIGNIGKLVGKEKELFLAIINCVKSGKTCWEYNHISGYQLWYSWDRSTNERILSWWKEAFGDLRVTSNDRLKDYADKKGIPCLRIKEGWADHLISAGVQGMDDVSPLIEKGMIEVETTDTLILNVDRVWNAIVSCNMHNNKAKPTVKMFDKNMDGNAQLWGLYKDNTIYIHEKAVDNLHVIVHELAHHITGANDCTNDFQEFLAKLCGKLIENHYG